MKQTRIRDYYKDKLHKVLDQMFEDLIEEELRLRKENREEEDYLFLREKWERQMVEATEPSLTLEEIFDEMGFHRAD